MYSTREVDLSGITHRDLEFKLKQSCCVINGCFNFLEAAIKDQYLIFASLSPNSQKEQAEFLIDIKNLLQADVSS